MKKDKPLVSVIIPVYNGAKFIGQAIESILGQTYVNWEILVIDDSSTDDTLNVVQSYSDFRIRVVKKDLPRGIARSRNIGVKNAYGEYIAMLDSDDVAYAYRLEKQVQYLTDRPEVNLVGSSYDICDADMNCYDAYYPLTDHNDIIIKQFVYNQFGQSTIMFRAAGEFEYDENFGSYCEDYDLWVRISRLGKLGNIQECLCGYRKHEDNITKLKLEAIILAEVKIFERQLAELELSVPDCSHKIITALKHGLKPSLSLYMVIVKTFGLCYINNLRIQIYGPEKFGAFLSQELWKMNRSDLKKNSHAYLGLIKSPFLRFFGNSQIIRICLLYLKYSIKDFFKSS